MTGGDWRDGGFGLRGALENEIANLEVVGGSGLPVPHLAALHSPQWAEQLRSLYESIAGVTLDPWWDLYALLHYDDSAPKWIRGQVAGRRRVDVPGMTARVETAVETALRRLG